MNQFSPPGIVLTIRIVIAYLYCSNRMTEKSLNHNRPKATVIVVEFSNTWKISITPTRQIFK